MRFLRSKRLLVPLTGLVAAGVAAAVAIPAVISQQVITDTNSVHLRVQRMVTDASGFGSGWHIHPGLAVIQLEEGSMQLYENGCTPKTLRAGDTSIEIPFQAVRAIATQRAVTTVTFILNGPDPVTIPLSRYAPGLNPCPTLP